MKNKIVYVMVIHDSFYDPGVEVYSNRDDAIKRARELASKYLLDIEDYVEHSIKGVEFSCGFKGNDTFGIRVVGQTVQ